MFNAFAFQPKVYMAKSKDIKIKYANNHCEINILKAKKNFQLKNSEKKHCLKLQKKLVSLQDKSENAVIVSKIEKYDFALFGSNDFQFLL